MKDNKETSPPEENKEVTKPAFSNTVTVWIGIVSSIITIILTVYTTSNKVRLDKLENSLNERSTEIEESKERVARYQWVYSLYGDLNSTDVRRKNFAVGLITLALNDNESKKLFSALQTSTDTVLQSVGQSGLRALKASAINTELASLISKVDTSNTAARISAVGELEKKYASSPEAITQILNFYSNENISTLSPDGIINGLYFLNRTDPTVWSQQQVQQGQDIIQRILALKPGPNTEREVKKFRVILQTAAKGK
ncbi:hypothetical protein LX99_03805 [Mucilaginibacter oryzae]|uniref:Uncharacterized protein n=1 Tax=Mucilaginibacter oryzae TaxID=468058 RepID=A0A316HK54_9SPHI|nr:hypothetical protein [Mucilaginibacter oryzae]PWK75312.1 hypothetical protein LX99_03805 [Mucilaginibacter oryzae]